MDSFFFYVLQLMSIAHRAAKIDYFKFVENLISTKFIDAV